MKRIVFLVSGQGGTLKFVSESSKYKEFEIEVVGVIADRECGALEFAMKEGIRSEKVDFKQDSQRKVAELITEIKPDIVITNVHKILNENILSLEGVLLINLHYSLLPAYAGMIGMKTVVAAQKDNVQFIGATCHKVTEVLDGGEILGQSIIQTNWDENTPEIYYDSIFKGSCLTLLNQLVSKQKNEGEISVHKEILFNPPLRFSLRIFDDAFWENIK